jgi:ABC-type polar amino acid transport system ATPase subunit
VPELGGIDLSGGQWQRVSIGRALFRREAQLLVFDEPTAALDPLAQTSAHLAWTEIREGQ